VAAPHPKRNKSLAGGRREASVHPVPARRRPVRPQRRLGSGSTRSLPLVVVAVAGEIARQREQDYEDALTKLRESDHEPVTLEAVEVEALLRKIDRDE
jgi:hypothetical protein